MIVYIYTCCIWCVYIYIYACIHICMNAYAYIYRYACKHKCHTFVCRHMFCASIIARRHIGGDTPPPKNQHEHQKIQKIVGPAGFSSSKPSTIRVQSLVSWKLTRGFCIRKLGEETSRLIGKHILRTPNPPPPMLPPHSPQRKFVNSVWFFGWCLIRDKIDRFFWISLNRSYWSRKNSPSPNQRSPKRFNRFSRNFQVGCGGAGYTAAGEAWTGPRDWSQEQYGPGADCIVTWLVEMFCFAENDAPVVDGNQKILVNEISTSWGWWIVQY